MSILPANALFVVRGNAVNMTIREGGVLNLTCNGMDDNLKWFFNGTAINNISQPAGSGDNGGDSINTTLVLVIENVTYLENEGTYTCVQTTYNTTAVEITVIVEGELPKVHSCQLS